jgi:hypothetical protein
MPRIHVIHWRPEEVAPLLEAVRKCGATVTYCEQPSGTAVASAIREHPPDAVLIDLSRVPSHGKEMAVWLRNRKSTRTVPIVFYGGEPAKISKLRELFPEAPFADSATLKKAIKSLPQSLPESVAVPVPMMLRYGNRTAAEKMGIKPGVSVSVMDPPRDYLTVLGQLPEGVELVEESEELHPVTLWFTHRPETLLTALPRMRRIASKSKLWVIWRKGSTNGITQNFVREAGIDAGLVDYKICSVDGVWSGMAFARSKK